MTEQDYKTLEAELLETLQNTKSERVKLRAAELLLTLQDRMEGSRWDPMGSPGSKRWRSGDNAESNQR